MAPVTNNKRRRVEDEVRRPKKKKITVKKQKRYHSSSEDESADETVAYDAPKRVKVVEPQVAAREVSIPKPILKHTIAVRQPQPASDESDADENAGVELDGDQDVMLDEVAKNTALNMQAAESSADEELDENDEPDLEAASSSGDEDEDSEPESETSMSSGFATGANKKKRNDPDAFATSISKILGSKLTTNKRADPVLSRSKSAADANKTLADERLEAKARAQMRAEKKAALDRGRVKDVLGLETDGVDTGRVLEEEKRLKKTAQRGVVKLFNAVRAAQVKAEEATRQARSEGVVGMGKREERVNEMSKQGFLDLISSGGKQKASTPA